MAALAALYANDLRYEDRVSGLSLGKAELQRSDALYAEADVARRYEAPIATLGDSLALFALRIVVRGSGESSLGMISDIEEVEFARFILYEASPDGRIAGLELFADDCLADAVVRLYERYAESLPEGVERTRAAGIAETLRLFVGPISPDALAPRYAPRLVQRDHRMLSEWSATSPDEAVAHLCAAASVVGNSRGRVVDVVAAGPSAYLTHVVSTGTSADGVESERLFLSLNAYAPDGRVQHIEFFDEGREAEALARFARIEMFDSEERDTALARFEELRDGRP